MLYCNSLSQSNFEWENFIFTVFYQNQEKLEHPSKVKAFGTFIWIGRVYPFHKLLIVKSTILSYEKLTFWDHVPVKMGEKIVIIPSVGSIF